MRDTCLTLNLTCQVYHAWYLPNPEPELSGVPCVVPVAQGDSREAEHRRARPDVEGAPMVVTMVVTMVVPMAVPMAVPMVVPMVMVMQKVPRW